jgi:hypothetical protein
VNLRDHPHVQGLLLGFGLLVAGALSSPFAIDAVTGVVDRPAAAVDDGAASTGSAKYASSPEDASR